MSNLKALRKRIASTQSVKQITQAMEMIAASRFRKASEAARASRPFADKLKLILEHLAAGEKSPPFFNDKPLKKCVVVIVAGEKGLCGSYNASVFAAAEKFLAGYKVEQVELILIGAKAIDYFGSGPWKIKDRRAQVQGKLSYEGLRELSDQWLSEFVRGEFEEMWLIYTRFINSLTREVVEERLLNLQGSVSKGMAANYIFEPSREAVLESVIPMYCTGIVQKMIQESWASELSSRVQAMRAATKNAGEMIEKLTLLRNKVRQEGITKEILEITAGAEGLKE